jgi:outer membrane protein TolC
LDSLAAEFEALTGVAYRFDDSTQYAFSENHSSVHSLAAEGLTLQAQGLQKAGDAATGSRYPMVNAFAGYRYGNPGMNQGIDEWMGYGVVGVQAQWNLFDGFERKSIRTRYSSDAEVLQAEAERIRKNQQSAMATLQVEISSMDSEQKALVAGLDASQQALVAYKASFAGGTALADDVRDAELRLAEFEARIAQWEIRKAMLEIRLAWVAGHQIQIVGKKA